MNRVKWILAIVGGVVIAALVAVALLFGNGAITVIAPAGAAVSVEVDDVEIGSVPAGAHARFNLEQGKRGVRVIATRERESTYTLEVGSGAFDQVLPVGEQCFAHLDVTRYWYDDTKPLSAVLVKATFSGSAPFDLPTGVHYATKDLPAELEDGQQAELLLEVPCVALSWPAETMIEQALVKR
jgi:hypothetical protein